MTSLRNVGMMGNLDVYDNLTALEYNFAKGQLETRAIFEVHFVIEISF